MPPQSFHPFPDPQQSQPVKLYRLSGGILRIEPTAIIFDC
jgi:hypothetical protein